MITTITDSPAPYYVHRNLCDGKYCVYTGIKILDYSAIVANTEGKMNLTINGVVTDFLNTSLITGFEVSNYEVAQSIQEAFLEAVPGSMPRVDFVVVADSVGSKVILYVKAHYALAISNYEVLAMDYLRNIEGYPETLYHLCKNISVNFGECREDDTGQKCSNIYGEYTEVVPGTKVWSNGAKPLIMANCKLCNYCILNCPRRAIHNKISGTSKTLIELGEGDNPEGELARQYYLNAQAKSGEYVYNNPGQVCGGSIWIGDTEPDTEKFNAWIDTSTL